MRQFFLRGLIMSGILFSSACVKGEQIRSYQVPKETSKVNIVQDAVSAPVKEAIGSSLEVQADSIVPPKWTVPDGWEVLPSNALKKGNFLVRDDMEYVAEITVIGFQGDVGGKLANINRWRQQVGLGPVDANYLKSLEKIEMDEGDATLVDLEGLMHRSIYAVIVECNGQSWFFKMMGDTAIVKKEKANFLKFLESIKFSDQKDVE